MRKVSVLIGICMLVALALTLVAQAPHRSVPDHERCRRDPDQA